MLEGRFFSTEPQMVIMRSYVLETAAFESARSLMFEALGDLQRTQTHMFASSSAQLFSGAQLRGSVADSPDADAKDVVALVLARQKLADAQENLAIKAQRVDFHSLCGAVYAGADMADPADMTAQYYGLSAFAGLFDVIDPLEHPVAAVAPSGQMRADLPVNRDKKQRVGLDGIRQTAATRL